MVAPHCRKSYSVSLVGLVVITISYLILGSASPPLFLSRFGCNLLPVHRKIRETIRGVSLSFAWLVLQIHLLFLCLPDNYPCPYQRPALSSCALGPLPLTLSRTLILGNLLSLCTVSSSPIPGHQHRDMLLYSSYLDKTLP